MDDARALLNSLMGGDRDQRADQRKVRHYSDSHVCRSFMMGVCPHNLFTNTAIDLGICKREHNDMFKDAFEADKEAIAAIRRRRWRNCMINDFKQLLVGVDRRIASNLQRIAHEKEGGSSMTEEQKQQISALKDEVADKLRQAENLADDGKFDESRTLMKDTDTMKRNLEDLKAKRYEKYKKEEICEICGLIIDAEEVEAMKTDRGWHINGRQHIGYKLLRERLVVFEEERAKDRQNGDRSPSPSPPPKVQKIERPADSKRKRDGSQERRRASRSRSQARRQKGDNTKRNRKSRSRSRSDARKRRRGSRSRSLSKAGRKTERRRRGSPSITRKSASPGTKRRKGKKSCSRSRSRAKQKVLEKKADSKKSRQKDASSDDAAAPPPPPADSSPPPPPKAAEAPAPMPAKAPAPELPAPAPAAPAAPAKPAPPPKPKSVADRPAPVFMLFRKTPAKAKAP